MDIINMETPGLILKKEFSDIFEDTAEGRRTRNGSFDELNLKKKMVPFDVLMKEFDNIKLIETNVLSPSKVYTCTKEGSQQLFVLKTIEKKMLEGDKWMMEFARREFPLHCSLDNEHIVEAYEYSENSEEHIMVMEYLPDACYFEEKIEIRRNPIKSEKKIKSYIADILKGLSYIHSKGIIHSDLKLENIFIKKIENQTFPRVKIGDFGLAHVIDPKTGKSYYSKQCGTYNYIAPELRGNCYVDEKIDIWALGVIAYKMAVAYRPTQISNYRYGTGPIPFFEDHWKNRTPEFKDFINSLLEVNPENRPSAQQALKHPWFSL